MAAQVLPQLPADFFDKKGGAAPAELPADFFEKQATAPKISKHAKSSLTGGLSKEQRVAQPNGYSIGEMASDAFSGPAAVMGLEGTAGAVTGLAKGGVQLAKGAVGPALKAARPAIGLAAGLGTAGVVNKAATYVGVPSWIADILAEGAGIAVGGKVGMSPDMQAKLKSSGIKGLISELFNGEVKESDAARFYRSNHPEIKGKLSEEQIQLAKVEATEFRRQAAAKLRALHKEAEAPDIASSRYAPTDKWGPAAAKLKNETMAAHFKEQGIDQDTVAKMTESELNAHLKTKGYKPAAKATSNNQTHRTYAETRADIAKAMKE